jgi:hypothetical protein
MAKARAEAQLKKEVTKRAEMVREIEELRRERDVFQRRIEFCKAKGRLNTDQLSCCLREYTVEEIKLATDEYSESLRLKTGNGRRTTVYKGCIDHDKVAIKLNVFNSSDDGMPKEDFQAKVNSHIYILFGGKYSLVRQSDNLTYYVFMLLYNVNLIL